jgi:hypothetical protein
MAIAAPVLSYESKNGGLAVAPKGKSPLGAWPAL